MIDEPIPPQEGDARQEADERFVHGLLAARTDGDAARQERVRRVLDAIAPPAAPRRIGRRAAMVAAAVALGTVTAFLVLSSGDGKDGDPPRDVVNAALVAAESPVPRRYEFRVVLHDDDAAPVVSGHLDCDGLGRMLVRATVHGHRVVMARTPGGVWSMNAQGHVVSEDDWPMLGIHRSLVMIESIEGVLGSMLAEHDLARGETDEHGRRVTATRTTPHRWHAESIDLWVAEDHTVKRLALQWPATHVHPHELHATKDPPRIHHEHSHAHGEHRLPPRRMIFELVGRPDLDEDWFKPESHVP